MNKENTLKLYRDFPSIFLIEATEEERRARAKKEFAAEESKIDFDGKLARLGYGFECGDGWFNLIHDLCEKIHHLSIIHDVHPYVRQVKEKFGTLSFYYGLEGMEYGIDVDPLIEAGNAAIFEAVQEASELSATTCEDCGKPAEMRKDNWIRVTCDDCESVRRKQRGMG